MYWAKVSVTMVSTHLVLGQSRVMIPCQDSCPVHSFSTKSASSGFGSPRMIETESLQLRSVIHSLRWPDLIFLANSFQYFSRKLITWTKTEGNEAPTLTTSSLWTGQDHIEVDNTYSVSYPDTVWSLSRLYYVFPYSKNVCSSSRL